MHEIIVMVPKVRTKPKIYIRETLLPPILSFFNSIPTHFLELTNLVPFCLILLAVVFWALYKYFLSPLLSSPKGSILLEQQVLEITPR